MASAASPLFKRLAVAFALSYVVAVIVLALLKGTSPVLGIPPWLIGTVSWAEVFYGPAITMGSCFGLFLLAHRVELWVRR